MPTYEYACTECGDRTEVVQSFSDAPPTTCPVCGGVLRKVFSPVGIVFKGSGFYRTDSRGKPSSSSKADGRGDGLRAVMRCVHGVLLVLGARRRRQCTQ